MASVGAFAGCDLTPPRDPMVVTPSPSAMARLQRLEFGLAYADQAERDHAALRAAVRAGIVEVQLEH